jgi:hypothetical protein
VQADLRRGDLAALVTARTRLDAACAAYERRTAERMREAGLAIQSRWAASAVLQSHPVAALYPWLSAIANATRPRQGTNDAGGDTDPAAA